MDALLEAAAAAAPAPTPVRAKAPSFLSPEPVTATSRDVHARTLSEGARKKQQHKRKAMGDNNATPTILKRKKKLLIGETPQTASKHSAKRHSGSDKENEGPLNKPRKETAVESATRRLEFAATPSKPAKKAKNDKPEESSSSSSSEDDGEHSSASSDECEVTFDAMTLGNLRIVREAVPSPLSTASTASSGSTKPIGLEYQFAVSSTVCSMAIAPNGKFIVVGFYNGTIYLYPLTQDSLRYRHGVMLDHISARGMYTQLMVRVAVPDDGKFIFAGVYRGSTEIRAIEVDSIELPSIERLAQAATSRGTDEEDSDDDSDHEEGSGVPHATAITHTYSDAKLKGFSDVKSVIRKCDNKTEYRLLCGLGIKNIHLWRFYHNDSTHEWAWECIFDKQNNGISIEMLCFHRDVDNQIIAKSEHQNIRIWNVEEDATSGELTKKSHVDIKQSVDATAVYGDLAYGGGEALALIDLRTSSRMELDLPLSVKEQEAKQASARLNAGTRITASLRGRRGTRGRGSADDANNGQRLMRMVSQVAGQDSAPFVVGMCTDGSVFMHRPQPETMGLATPLEYVEGYEEYFQDPSLGFQAQYSDLTRVNTCGLLSVLPLPKTEKEEWMVVAANAKRLLVRSMEAFIHRNQHKKETGRVKRGLRNGLREMGNDTSSSGSDSDEESSSDEEIIKRKPARVTVDSTRDEKREKVEKRDQHGEEGKSEKPQEKCDGKVDKSSKEVKAKPTAAAKEETSKTSSLAKTPTPQTGKPFPVPKIRSQISDEPADKGSALVSTPVRSTGLLTPRSLGPRSMAVPSPVVSISSPSASSNPNTPERVKLLPDDERRALVVKELEWTPQANANITTAPTSVTDNQGDYASKTEESTREPAVTTKRGRSQKRKPGKGRSKGVAQALFVNDEVEPNQDAPAKTTLKRPAHESLDGGAKKKLAVDVHSSQVSPQSEEACTDVEECEEIFTLTPLLSDGGSLLAAAIYQYSENQSFDNVESARDFNVDEIQLVMRFSSQLERLKRSYSVDRERIMHQFKVTECDCGSTKKKAPSNLNWRKQIANEATKKKHMKRRHKKLLASRLRDLQTSYEAKLRDIQIIQRLELQAFTARQEFQLLASQA